MYLDVTISIPLESAKAKIVFAVVKHTHKWKENIGRRIDGFPFHIRYWHVFYTTNQMF
jgi:hypothetical protein